MKKNLLLVAVFLVGFASQAQQELGIVGSSNWLNGWSTFNPVHKDYPKTTKILSGKISSDLTLSNLETYNLIGEVHVTNNATLTIQPGTIIRASSDEYSSLIITKGSKIIAQGDVVNPIVFTSDKPVNERKPGDWGGIYILGGAPLNTYGNIAKIESEIPANFKNCGGDLVEDNSGVLKNVRIEFAGKGKTRYETNSALSLVAVGSQTVLESIQISVSNGNSFKVIGGNVKATKLVSYRSKNSDYEFSQGANANVENGLAIRYPFFSANSDFRAVTVRPYENFDLTDFSKPSTNVNLVYFTILNESESNQSANGLIKEAVFVHNKCNMLLKNSVISGFDSALLLDDEIDITDANLNKIKLQRVFINNCKKNIITEKGGVLNDDLEFYYASKAFGNVYSKTNSEELFVDAVSLKSPDFRIKIGSIN
ncbi:hypothetical protein ACFS5J_09300 [Flavobacterium chuncheonense]|uniref:T9SS C-terminal target domain-containing protein n=1 Tax=Flavobacterium chuncheonense TaxID=2026653 RepID=A0ABW5YM84_9FLAO